MATVTGLSANRYYIDNPIWVDVDTTGDAIEEHITLNITLDSAIVFSAKYYTYEGLISFDLSEAVKSLMPEPNHPNGLIDGSIFPNNSVTLTISLGSFSQTKIFYRGGKINNASNVQVPSLALLSESEKIPVWTGYPSAKYTVNGLGQIIYNNILSTSEIENRKVVNCDSVFLRFLNTKGGYSYWLFEQWEVNDKYKKGTMVERREKDLDLGSKPDYSFESSTRVEERYMPTMRALLQSTDIYIYRLDNIIQEVNPQFISSTEWNPIYNDGGGIKWNAFDSVYEVDFKFDLRLKNNPSLVW